MWEHKTEEPAEQEIALGTIPALTRKPNEPPMAYTITLGYRPAFDSVWQDGDEVQVDREPPRACVYMMRHELAGDPLGEGPKATDSVRVCIPLDYDGEAFPTSDDVESGEWEDLFHEAGYEWPEYRRGRVPFASWVHLVSATLRAAGVGV